MKFLYTSLLVMLGVNCLFAQNQGNQWYFGTFAGLDFNSGTPVAISTSQIYAFEGCASLADKTTGNLLFYTDGTTVYDASNNMMQNGYGLGGSNSTTQSAVIVPMPGSTTKFYVFTADAQADFYGTGDGGINYNIIDMSLNGGLGAVTTLNQLLITPTTEKFATKRTCDGNYWLVGHGWNNNNFDAFLVTPSGISAPVVSSVGIVHQDIGSGNNAESIGYMRISPDGKKLAVACYEQLNTVQIFDFDINTGIVSNPITDSNYPNFSGDDGPYGLSFSPDNSKLYVGYLGEFPTYSQVYQYDLLAGNASAIVASRYAVGTDSLYTYGGIQIGPDGKVYVDISGGTALDVINNPNAAGAACNYAYAAVDLGGNYGQYGLPDILLNDTSSGSGLTVEPQSPEVCNGQSVVLSVGGSGTFTWSPSASLNSTSGDSVIATPTATTTYTVTDIGGGNCSGSGSVVVTVLPAPNKPTITISVTGDSLISSATQGNQWYLNDTTIQGSTNQFLVINGQTGSYTVSVINPANGCSSTSTAFIVTGINQLASTKNQLSIYPNPTSGVITISSSKNINELTVTNLLGQLIYTAQPKQTTFNFELKDEGMYFVTVKTGDGIATQKVIIEK